MGLPSGKEITKSLSKIAKECTSARQNLTKALDDYAQQTKNKGILASRRAFADAQRAHKELQKSLKTNKDKKHFAQIVAFDKVFKKTEEHQQAMDRLAESLRKQVQICTATIAKLGEPPAHDKVTTLLVKDFSFLHDKLSALAKEDHTYKNLATQMKDLIRLQSKLPKMAPVQLSQVVKVMKKILQDTGKQLTP